MDTRYFLLLCHPSKSSDSVKGTSIFKNYNVIARSKQSKRRQAIFLYQVIPPNRQIWSRDLLYSKILKIAGIARSSLKRWQIPISSANCEKFLSFWKKSLRTITIMPLFCLRLQPSYNGFGTFFQKLRNRTWAVIFGYFLLAKSNVKKILKIAWRRSLRLLRFITFFADI